MDIKKIIREEVNDFEWVDDVGYNPLDMDWTEYYMRTYLEQGNTIDFYFHRIWDRDTGRIDKYYERVYTLSKEGKRYVVTTEGGIKWYYKLHQVINYIKRGEWELIE